MHRWQIGGRQKAKRGRPWDWTTRETRDTRFAYVGGCGTDDSGVRGAAVWHGCAPRGLDKALA